MGPPTSLLAGMLLKMLVLQGLIFLFVLMGLAIVVGLPFVVAKRRRIRRAPGDGKGAFISLTNLFSGKDAHSS